MSTDELVEQIPNITTVADASEGEFPARLYAFLRPIEDIVSKMEPGEVVQDSKLDHLIQQALSLEPEIDRRLIRLQDLKPQTELEEDGKDYRIEKLQWADRVIEWMINRRGYQLRT